MKNYGFLFLVLGIYLSAQDTIPLGQVVVGDTYLHKHNASQSKLVISDTTLIRYPTTLTTLLAFESPIYFKENGRGMVSSPSFRGTTASQTAVIWNGININSNINGQVDFNTLLASAQDRVTIRPGGGSIGYGTGAIGGSIHLENTLNYKPVTAHEVNLGYGSFDTWRTGYQYRFGNGKWASNVSFERNQSANDYAINKHIQKNKNGKYYLNAANANAGYKLSPYHEIRLYSAFNWGSRELSLIGEYETPTKYDQQDLKVMTEWIYQKKGWQSELKLAYLEEETKYFSMIYNSNYDLLNVKNLIANYYLRKKISPNLELSALAEFIRNEGRGTNLEQSDRQSTNFAFIAQHQLSDDLKYEASVRQNFSTIYNQPLVYSLGINYQPTPWYQLRASHSKNYRIPTFNDLYWQTVGNKDLKPELAYQFEVGNDIIFKDFRAQTNVFYNAINDMIIWSPTEGSFWKPTNEAKVKTYGFELMMDYSWRNFQLKGHYSYTEAKNKATNDYLIYTPKHRATFGLNYAYNQWNIWLQNQWNGRVYTQSSNQKSLKGYSVSNLGVSYQPTKIILMSGQVNNLFNQVYESVEDRWQPRLHYMLNLNIKL